MFYHNELEKRRCPIKEGNIQAYRPKLCEFYCKTGNCPNSDRCIYCHGNNELQFHPMLYKMRLCKNVEQYGGCQYEVCSYAHFEKELRKPLKFQTIDVEKFDMSDLPDFTDESYVDEMFNRCLKGEYIKYSDYFTLQNSQEVILSTSIINSNRSTIKSRNEASVTSISTTSSSESSPISSPCGSICSPFSDRRISYSNCCNENNNTISYVNYDEMNIVADNEKDNILKGFNLLVNNVYKSQERLFYIMNDFSKVEFGSFNQTFRF